MSSIKKESIVVAEEVFRGPVHAGNGAGSIYNDHAGREPIERCVGRLHPGIQVTEARTDLHDPFKMG